MSFVIRYIVSSTGAEDGQRLAALSIASSFGMTNWSRTAVQNFSSGEAGVGGRSTGRAHPTFGETNGAAPPMARSRADSRRFIRPPQPGDNREHAGILRPMDSSAAMISRGYVGRPFRG